MTWFADALLQASDKPGTGDNTTTIQNLPTLSATDVLTNGLNIMYYVLGAIAVIIIIVAGIMYASSNGTPQIINRAKSALTYAIVGLVVVLLAFTITQFITGKF